MPERAGDPPLDTAPATEFAGVICARWRWSGTGQPPETAVFTATTVPGGPGRVRLAQADGAGPHIDAVSLPPGHSAYVRAAGAAGDGHRPDRGCW